MSEKQMLTITDLKAISGVGRSLLYALVSRGEIPAYRIGDRILVKREDWQSFFDNCRVSAPPAALGRLLEPGGQSSAGETAGNQSHEGQ